MLYLQEDARHYRDCYAGMAEPCCSWEGCGTRAQHQVGVVSEEAGAAIAGAHLWCPEAILPGWEVELTAVPVMQWQSYLRWWHILYASWDMILECLLGIVSLRVMKSFLLCCPCFEQRHYWLRQETRSCYTSSICRAKVALADRHHENLRAQKQRQVLQYLAARTAQAHAHRHILHKLAEKHNMLVLRDQLRHWHDYAQQLRNSRQLAEDMAMRWVQLRCTLVPCLIIYKV